MCVLLGAITPDHEIKRIGSRSNFLRFTRDARNRQLMKEIHRKWI